MPRKSGKKAKYYEKYGKWWKADIPIIRVELWCYLNDWSPDKGGLGKEKHFLNAFKIMWPNFIWHEWCYMLIHAWCHEEITIVLGHTRASKTYISSYIAYLDFCADPENTMTSISTVTFPGLRARMWADLMIAVKTATVKFPFVIRNSTNEMKIAYPDENNRPDLKCMIEGFALAKTGDAAEKIQGMHKDRRRWILDEAEGVSQAIFDAEENPRSAKDYRSLKLANPVDKMSAFGLLYEPEGGWDSVSPSDLFWRSKKGHLVLHFDGLQSFNIKLAQTASKKEYEEKEMPFLLTQRTVDNVLHSHGPDSVQYWKYIRGFPPPDGTIAKAFPEVVLSKMRKDIAFDYPPKPFAVMDPAFDYDNCIMHVGAYGNNRKNQCCIQFYSTHEIKTKIGPEFEPKDYQIARRAIDICKENNVLPEDYIQDGTGNARGVFAIMQEEWDKKVHSCQFGGKPTKRKIKLEDKEDELPIDLYVWFVDELWFRFEAWGRSGLVGGLDNLDTETLFDLGARIYQLVPGKERDRQRLETKKEMRSRIGRSPDYGDAAVLASELLALKGIYVGGNMFLGTTKTTNVNSSQRSRAKRAGRHYLSDNVFSSD